MEYEEMLKRYKKIDDLDKQNLYCYAALKECYDYDEDMEDALAIAVVSLAYECWGIENNKNNNSLSIYTNYLLSSIHDFGATYDDIIWLEPEDVVKAYNNGVNPTDLIKLDVSDMEYCFTNFENHKFYEKDCEVFVVDKTGRDITPENRMGEDDVVEDFFEFFRDEEVKDISLTMHYYIRQSIVNASLTEEEAYKEIIENYEKYCEEHFITSKIILNALKFKTDMNIDLFEFDKRETKEVKMKKLYKVLEDSNLEISNNLYYVASFDNGNDYYYDRKNNDYILIDRNNEITYFSNDSFLILKELKDKDKITYISNEEIREIMDCFHVVGTNKIPKNLETSNVFEFIEYLEKNDCKELEELNNSNLLRIYNINKKGITIFSEREFESLNAQRMEFLHKASNDFVSSIFEDKKQGRYDDYDR